METLTDRIRRVGKLTAAPTEASADIGQIDEREKAIIDRRTSEAPGVSFLQKAAKGMAEIEIDTRRQQRAYAEQAPQETAGPVREMLSNLGNRDKVLGTLRQMSPEQRDEALRLAPGIAQQLGDDRGGAVGRTLGALSRGVSHGVSQPAMELLGLGGTAEEIDYIRQLDAAASQEFSPARPGDPWYERGPLQAVEMAPWMATVVGGAGLGRAALTTAAKPAAAAMAARAGMGRATLTAAGKVGELAGITAAAFPSQYAQEVDQLKELGMEDNLTTRLLAGGTATVTGLIEGIVPNPFKAGPVQLTEGAIKAARQYLWNAAKQAPGELTEEYLQGVTSGLGQHVAQYLDANAEDKSIADAFKTGWDQAKEAALPMAFLLGVPAAGGAGVAATQARLARLQEIRAKGFVSAEDAAKEGIEGKNRKERKANVNKQIEELTQQAASVEPPPERSGTRDDIEIIGPEYDPASPTAASQPGATPTQTLPNPAQESVTIKPGEQQSPSSVREQQWLEDQVKAGKWSKSEEKDGALVYSPITAPPQKAVDPERDQAEDELAGLLGEDTPSPSSNVQDDEPPIAEGMTRLYHGSATPGRTDGKAWFSTDRRYAENYRGKDTSELQYTDVPTKWVNEKIDPDNYGQTVERGFTWAGELDSSETGPRKIISKPSTAGPSEGSTKPTTVPPVVSPDAPAKPETSMGETAGKNQPSEARADEHAKLPMFSVYPTTLGGKEKFAVKEFENKGFGDSLFDTEAEATKQAEISKRQSDEKTARQEKAKADEDAAVKKQQEYEGSFQGFLSDTPMVKGRQLSTLGKQRSYQGKVVTVKELIEQKVADGAIVNEAGQLESPDGAYLGSDKITKIGIDYARHLISTGKPTSAGPSEEISTKPTTGSTVVSPDAPTTPETSMGETGKGQSSEARADIESKRPKGLPPLKPGFARVVHIGRAGDEESLKGGLDYSKYGMLQSTARVWSDEAQVEYDSKDPRFAGGTAYVFDVPESEMRQHGIPQVAPGKIPGEYYVGSTAPPVPAVAADSKGTAAPPTTAPVDRAEPKFKPGSVAARAFEAATDDPGEGVRFVPGKGFPASFEYEGKPTNVMVESYDQERGTFTVELPKGGFVQGIVPDKLKEPADADIVQAISNFKNTWGMEATATPADKLSAEQQEALDFATSRGQKMAFVDIAKSDKKAPIGSFQRNEKVVLISNELKGDKLWGMIGHEMAHSKGLDEILPADSAELKTMMDEYFQSASPDVQKRLKTSKRDHQREGRARMVQKFFEDKAFRDQLKQDNPSMWEKLREAVLKFIGQWTPKDEAKRVLLEELRAAPKPEKSKGKKPIKPESGLTKPELATPLDPVKRIENLIEQKRATGRDPSQALLDKLAEAKAAEGREPTENTQASADQVNVDSGEESKVNPEDELASLRAKSERMYDEVERLQNAGKDREANALLREAEKLTPRIKELEAPLIKAKQDEEVAAKEESRKAYNAKEDARKAALPTKQTRNGWELATDGARWFLRDPNTKEIIYEGSMKRVREVADESPPDAPSVKPELAPDTARLQAEQEAKEQAKTDQKQRVAPEGYALLPEKTRTKFEAAWDGTDPQVMKGLLGIPNKALRAEFERRSDSKLPRTIKGTEEVVDQVYAAREAGRASGSKSNWREAFDSFSDPYKKTQLLRALANKPSTPNELSDILDRVTGLEDETNIRWAVGLNPAATEEIIVRAETEGAGVTTDDGKIPRKTPAPAIGQSLPWTGSTAEQETDWYGTKVSVAPANRREDAYSGQVVRVLNGGDMVEVQPDGQDGTFRVDSSRITLAEEQAATTEKQAEEPAAETLPEPTIPTFTRTTPDKGSTTRQFQSERVEKARAEISDLDRKARAKRSEHDGLRSNATKKRAAVKKEIYAINSRIQVVQGEIASDFAADTLAKLEDELESPRSYDHYLAGMKAIHKLKAGVAEDAARRGDMGRESARAEVTKEEKEADRLDAELQSRAKEIAMSKGFTSGDADQIALSASNGFTVFEDRSLADVVDVQSKRTRESRVSQEIGKLKPEQYGRKELNDEQIAEFTNQYQEVSLDDKDWLAKRGEVDKAVRAAINANREAERKREDDERKEKEAQRAKDEQEALANARERAKKYFLDERISKALKKQKPKTKPVKLRQESGGGPVKIVEGKTTDGDQDGELYPNGLILHKTFEEDSKDFVLTHARSGSGFPFSAKKSDMQELIGLLDILGLDFNVDTDEKGALPSELTSRVKKINTAWDNGDYATLSEQDYATVKSLAEVAKTDIDADLILTADDLGANGIPPGLDKVFTDRGLRVVKGMAEEVPEFAYDPVFTVKDGMLLYRDGYEFNIDPTAFNLHPSELKEGQTVGINLEDLGIKRFTPQDVVAEMMKQAGMPRVTKNKGGDVSVGYVGAIPASLQQGKDDNEWNVVGGTRQVREVAVTVLKKIRWRQPGQDGDPKTDIDVMPEDNSQATDSDSQTVPTIQSEEAPTIDPFSERSPESAERRRLIGEAKNEMRPYYQIAPEASVEEGIRNAIKSFVEGASRNARITGGADGKALDYDGSTKKWNAIVKRAQSIADKTNAVHAVIAIGDTKTGIPTHAVIVSSPGFVGTTFDAQNSKPWTWGNTIENLYDGLPTAIVVPDPQAADSTSEGPMDSLPENGYIESEAAEAAKFPPPQPKTKLKKAAEKANKELADAIDEFGNVTRGKLGMNLPLNPEVIAAAAKVVSKAIKAGTLNFAELMERMVAKYGEKMAERMRGALQQEWDKQVNAYPIAEDGIPPETPQPHPELVQPEAIPLTSVKNAIVDELRTQRGQDLMPEVTPQTVQQWLEAAGNRIASDPYAGNTLVEQLLSGEKTSVDEMEGMVLQYHYRAVNNLFEAADAKLTEAKANGDPAAIAIAQDDARVVMRRLSAIETALDKAGTAWGRAGVSRQIFLKQDFSLASMVRRARVANGGNELSDEQVAKISEQAKQIEELQKRIAELEAKTAEQEQQKAIDEAIKKDIEETKKPPAAKPKSKVRLKAEERVASAWEKFRAVAKGNLYSGVDIRFLPSAIEVIKAYTDLGMVTFREFMYTAAKNMGAKEAKAAEPTFRAAWDQLAADGEIAQPSLDMTNVGQLTRFARQVQRSLVENGVTEREEIVDAVHDALREILPEITRRQTMDALSSYGQFSQLSKDPIDQIIRDINGQLQQLAKLEDMERGQAPAKTGVERRSQSDEERRLTQLVNEAKRRGGFVVTDPETQLKSAMAAAKTAVRNRIADMDYEIRTGSRVVRNKTELIPDAELEQLRKDRDELRKVHKDMFPPKGATQAQKVASANRALDAAIASLEAKLAAGDISPAPQAAPLSTPELDAKRARLKQLHDQRNALRKIANPGMTAEEKKIRALDKSIEELEKQLATGNFAPKPKPTPLTSPEINARQAKLEELRATKKAILAAANPKMTPEERASRAYEAHLRKQLAMYLEKIAQGDFAPKVKKPPRVLTKGELDLKKQLADVKHDFFEALAKYHLDNLSPVGRAIDAVRESAHLSRAIMTSIDLSAVLRQGGLGVYSHPAMARKAAAEMWSAIWSREKEFQSMEKLRARPNAQLYEESGLNITDSEGKLTRQEEAFMGRWARTGIDVAGKNVQAATKFALEPVAASARAYVTFINNLRADLFDVMVENLGQGGQVTKEEAKLIAKYINVATGRSDLKSLNEKAATLNTVFFAPRYVASRFQYLAMPLYLLGTKDSARVKRLIAAEYARTLTGAAVFVGSLAVLAYLSAGDDDEEKPTVEINPLSSDFGKVRIDETRLDPLAGLAQVIVFSSRMLSFHTKSSTTGKIKPFYDGGPFETTHASEAWRFLRTKLAPVPGAAVTAASSMEDVVGQKVTPVGLVAGLFVPISVSEVVSTMQHRGIPKGLALDVLNILGASVNTYGPKTAYLDATPEEQAKQVDKYIKYMNWESDLPAFSQYLKPEDLKRVQARQDERKGDLVFEAMAEVKPNEEDAAERHKKVTAEFEEFRKQYAPTYGDALRYLTHHYDDEGGVKVQGANKLKPSFIERRNRLAAFYQSQ